MTASLSLSILLISMYLSYTIMYLSPLSLSLLSFSLSSPSSLLSLSFLLYLHSLSLSFSLSYLFLSLFVCLKPNHLPLSPISPPPSPSSPPSAHHRPLLAAPFPSQLIVNEFDGPREATPAGTRLKASGSSKCSAPPETPRNQSKAPITSITPECEKHTTRSIANLPEGHMGSNGHHVACASGALRVEHRRLLSIVWHVRIFQREMLVCVCSRKRGAAEADDSCYSYHTRHPLDFIYTHPDFLDPD